MDEEDNITRLPFCAREDVEAEIRRIATEDSARVVLLPHARDRMLQRDISTRQVFNALRFGSLDSAVEWDTNQDRGWKCRFSRLAAGAPVTVVVKLIEHEGRRCLVVTVW